MKKLITLILGVTLFYSCSTSSDGNGNNTTTVVPVAPSNLTGTSVSNSQINLFWTDNSTNETGFKIERKTGIGAYAAVASTAANTTTYNDTGLIPNTTYTYRVYANNAGGNSLTYSNEIAILTTVLPIAPSNLTGTIVPFNNQINLSWTDNATDETGFKIERKTETGTYAIVGSTATNINTFNDVVLTPSTTYTYRVYSYNSLGNSTTYSNEFTITSDNPKVIDVDGNTYETVTICNHTWMKTNLNVSKYRNGDVIPQVTDPTVWRGLTTGAWCYYGNDSANGTTYGKLYNWYAVVDPRGLAPLGYHIPSNAEWNDLANCSSNSDLKEIGTVHWQSPNYVKTNSSEFIGLPGGTREYNDGGFHSLGIYGNWWSSSEYDDSRNWISRLNNRYSYLQITLMYKTMGYSVRCVWD
jgi:uncharacterized protein (TIGR02145 family)